MNTRRSPKRTKLKPISSRHLRVSDALQEALLHFIEYHPPQRLNRNLRKMLIEYLMDESSVEDLHLNDLLYNLQGLFELCDAIEMEGQG